MPDPDPAIELLQERAWRQVAAIDRALEEGRIDPAAGTAHLVGAAVPGLFGTPPAAQTFRVGLFAGWAPEMAVSDGFMAAPATSQEPGRKKAGPASVNDTEQIGNTEMPAAKHLTAEQRRKLLGALQARFEKNMHRHSGLEWAKVRARLEANPERLWSLNEMERTGGEPDLVGYDPETGEYVFYDCAPESPKGRRSLCYDRQGLEARKEFQPKDSARDMAAAMGIELLTEDQYRELQRLGEFDTKTSSWVQTPADIRGLGGALFADRRYDTVFVYHNSAPSYYAARGFRGLLRV